MLQQSAATALWMTGADPQVKAIWDISPGRRVRCGGGGLLGGKALAILGDGSSSKQVGTLSRALRDGSGYGDAARCGWALSVRSVGVCGAAAVWKTKNSRCVKKSFARWGSRSRLIRVVRRAR